MSDFSDFKINPFQGSEGVGKGQEAKEIPNNKGNPEPQAAEKEFGVASSKGSDDDKICAEIDSKSFDADFSNLDFSSFSDKGKDDANSTGNIQDVSKKENIQ